MAAKANASEYRKNKYRAVFDFMDRNKDGFLTEDDFFENVKDLGKMGRLAEERKIRYQREMLAYWVLYEDDARLNKGKVDKETFVQRNVANHVRPETVDELTRHYGFLFDYIDTNQDGKISVDELNFYYKAHNWTNESHVKEIFRRLDKNADGYITRDELVHAGIQFWLSDDRSKGYHWMYTQNDM